MCKLKVKVKENPKMKVKVIGYKPIEVIMEVDDKYGYLLKDDKEYFTTASYDEALDLMDALIDEATERNDFEWTDRVYTEDGSKCLASN